MRVRRPKLRVPKPARPSMPRVPRPHLTPPSLWSQRAKAAAIVLVAAIGAIGGYGASELLGSDPAGPPPPAPTVLIEKAPQPEAAEAIGFPAFATRNTTRVGGVDPIADAAGVALASYPSVGGVDPPRIAVLAPAEQWQAAVASASLAADPVDAPILLGQADGIPAFTAEALAALSPAGLDRADGAGLVAVGDVAKPDGLKALTVVGGSPAAIAKALDQLRSKLSGQNDPDHLLVVSSDDAASAMPAAAWAARSGDPILFAAGSDVPKETLAVIERHPDTPVYVLGAESVISAKAVDKLRSKAPSVTRVGKADPVENAIEFAHFVDGDFGWNINDPGHGFVIANLSRTADAAAAAPLSAGGKPGPLLLTDGAETVPSALRGFLLDTKPGYTDDPVRAIYNHVWLIGDATAISVAFQAQVDELTKLVPVRSGTGGPKFGPVPGTPEAEPKPPRP